MTWRRAGRYWIESDTHTIAKIFITKRGPVEEPKDERVLYEVWRTPKPRRAGGQVVRLEGHYATADEAKAAAEQDAMEAA